MSTAVITPARSGPSTVNELCDRYQTWAENYYQLPDSRGQRRPTCEHKNMKDALRALRATSGEKDPRGLQAEDLCACQMWMVATDRLARSTINARINRIRRVIKWATKPPHRWLPPEVLTDFKLVEAIPWGRSQARETEDVGPVSQELVTATMAAPGLPRQLYAMIDLQWQTGMRPGELVRLRRQDLKTERPRLATGSKVEVMVYRPAEHKTRHRGLDRNIFFGPEAKRIVEDLLRTPPRPQRRRRASWPKASTGMLFNYTVNSFREAVTRINKRNGLQAWTPNQIRHSFATRMRSVAGIDVVQVLMGHRHRRTTEIYAQPDCSLAIEAIFKFG